MMSNVQFRGGHILEKYKNKMFQVRRKTLKLSKEIDRSFGTIRNIYKIFV